MPKKAKYCGVYDTEIEAVRAVSAQMRSLTDAHNREYACFIRVSRGNIVVDDQRVPQGKYVTSRLIQGQQTNVVRTAIAHAFVNFLPRFIAGAQRQAIVHTHPDMQGYLNNNFSGNPEKWWDFGDVSVPTLLRYSGIYLLAPNGCMYRYDGRGSGDTRASTLKELRLLPAIETGLSKSTVRYLKDPKTGKYYPVDLVHTNRHAQEKTAIAEGSVVAAKATATQKADQADES